MSDKREIRTIADIAKLAGVSAGTVSRALSGSTLISQKTRARIQALADENEFRPNIMARNLRTQKTGAIGVVIPLGHEKGQHISDPFFMTMLGLIADALTEQGYDLLLSRVIPDSRDWLDRYAGSGRVDGVIVIGQSDQSETLDAVARRYRPLVVWGGYQSAQEHCSVGSDNIVGGEIAAKHLIERGARRLAFLGDPTALEIAQRLEGVRKVLGNHGLAEEMLIYPAHLTTDAETSDGGIAEFLKQCDVLPDGIICASDVVAMSCLSILSEMGVSVPNEVKLIGYDGLPLGEHTVPRLTTVKQDFATGAHNLVDLLMRRIGGEDTASVIMPPKLAVRMSS